jgi:hypothetical protein
VVGQLVRDAVAFMPVAGMASFIIMGIRSERECRIQVNYKKQAVLRKREPLTV